MLYLLMVVFLLGFFIWCILATYAGRADPVIRERQERDKSEQLRRSVARDDARIARRVARHAKIARQ